MENLVTVEEAISEHYLSMNHECKHCDTNKKLNQIVKDIC